MKNRFFLIFLIFFISLFSVSAVNVSIEVNESSSLTKLGNGGYSLIADGILEISNPSNVSKVYEFELPLELDSLIGINKISLNDIVETWSTYNNVTNTTTNHSKTIKFGSEKFLFQYNKIEGYLIEANESISVGYHIFGILDYNLYDKLNSGQSVLDYYVKDYNLRGKIILNLQKPEREEVKFNIDGSINNTPTGNSTRLISSQIRNPTDFDYLVNELKIYRSDIANPQFDDNKIITKEENLEVKPFDFKEIDFFDSLSSSNSVYWMSADTIIKTNKFFSVLTNYKVQQSSSGGGSSGGKSSSGGSGFSSFENKDLLSILLKKETDKTIIRSGEEFKVFLRVVNVNDFELKNLVLYDEIPQGYEIKDVSESVKISEGHLTFDIDTIDSYETKLIEYTLISNDDDYKGITYLKPAELNYDDKEFFSEGVILINDLLPEEKVFVQKEVKYISDDFAQVKITVKNLGNYKVEDLLVSDFISQGATVKDISKMFYEDRGTWFIKTLNSGEEWEVTYLIDRDAKLDSLPNIFGVDKSEVYGTFISSGEVITVFKEEPHTIEKVGMGLAVGFLILYLLF